MTMAVANFILIVAPGLAIAGWLSFLFIRRRQYEKGVIVFLSITLAPLLGWYLTTWLRDESPFADPIYNSLPSGFVDSMPGLAMVGTFVWLCVHWARRGQQVEDGPATPAAGSTTDGPPPAPPPLVALSNGSVRERLETLERLRKDGLVSEEEYASKRAEILASI